MDFSSIFDIVISLFTLTLLEIVLGVDNLVFISIISSRLPKPQQKPARRLGLLLALLLRWLLLFCALWLVGLTHPLFSVFSHTFSSRDIFLLCGGLFLLWKGTQEIHAEFEHIENPNHKTRTTHFINAVAQIALFDIIFSLDSVITAIGLTQIFWIMAVAIGIAIFLMIFASEPLSRFIEKYPTIKMLALSFLLLIGTVLMADGFAFHVPREYVYFALCFSIFVEMLNMLLRNKRKNAKHSITKR